MKLEKFATETKNTTELLVTQEKGKLIIQAEEIELNHELEQVTANVQFISNLQADRVDELTVIITEVE